MSIPFEIDSKIGTIPVVLIGTYYPGCEFDLEQVRLENTDVLELLDATIIAALEGKVGDMCYEYGYKAKI
jgi:hypothetical protein